MGIARAFFRHAVLAFAALGLSAAALAQDGAAPKLRPTADQLYALQSQLQALPTAPGQGLVKAIPPRADAPERGLSAARGVARARIAEIEPDYLSALTRGPEIALTREGRLSADAQLYVINLFDDLSVRLAKLDITRDALGHDVWRGSVVGAEAGEATLVIDDGLVTGKIRIGAKTYGIQPTSNGLHAVLEYDESKIPVVDDDTQRRRGVPAPAAPDLSDTPPAADQRERAQAVTTVNLLVVYTARALQLRPNITSDISLFLSNLNTTLSNSATNVQFALVGTNQVNYTETSSTTMNVLLDDASNGAGDFSRIAALRASLQADLVQVWGVTTDGCGLAWLNDNLDGVSASNLGYSASYGTGVVQVDATGSCTNTAYDAPTHEVGHNIGAQHDRYAQDIYGGSNVAGPQGYNYGYIDTTARFSDVMAYGSQSSGRNLCNDNNVSCPHIPYFSNPNVTYQGRPVGIADSQPTAANNARRIAEIIPYIVQFRTFIQQPRMNIFISGTSGGGTVTSSTGLNCTSTCTGTNNVVAAGTVVTLTATPASGRSFTSWGSNSCLSTTATSTGGTCTIVMNGWQYVNASFGTASATTQTLTVTKGGTGQGTVTSSPSGINCGSTCSASFTASSTVTLTAAASSGSTFAGWSNGCTGSAATCTVTMSQARSVTATFNLSQSNTQTLTLTMSGSGTVTSAPSGLSCTSSCTGNFTAGTQVVLTATAGTGATFTGWSGGLCTGTATCTVTMTTARSVTATFTQATSSTQAITLTVTGSGTVTSSPSGFNCRSSCTASFTTGSSVTLTATPSVGWTFVGWNGACPGTDTCTVTAAAGTAVNAVFVQPSGVTVNLGSVYSTSQSSLQSFIRLFNTSNSPGTVQLTLMSDATGASLGQWTSPSIPAGASRQFSVDEIERGTGATFTRPSNYTVLMQPTMTGYTQHVLYRPSDGTLTNLSTCDTGVTANPTQLINVHSSIIDFGFPSTVVVNSTGSAAATVQLGIYDATTGAKLGSGNYSVSVPGGGQSRIGVATMEQALGIVPTQGAIYHYVVKIENQFTGFLQHLVTNLRVGVITDMTTVCSLGTLTATSPSSLRISSVYSSSQTASQSFLRFHNTSSSAGTVRITLASDASGATLAQWTSPSVPAGASAQYALSRIESEASQAFAKPSNYSLSVQPQVTGTVQHVLYRPADGTLTNLSTCDAGVAIESTQLINVHSTFLGAGFPSTVVVTNTGSAAANVSLGVYDATTGAKLSSANYTVSNVPSKGQARVLVSAIESALGINPASSAIYHYVVKVESSGFTGYLQHLVNNVQAGVITDMTTVCAMSADDVSPDSTSTSGTITLGTPATGTIGVAGDTDWYRVSLIGGTTYRITLQGASSSAGTLSDPVLYVRDSNGTVVASNDDNGSSLDSQLDFTASGSGAQTYYLVATGYSSATGTYRLSASATTASGDDFTPDSTSTNGTLTVGTSRTGTIGSTGDRDWFGVSLTSGTTYVIDLTGASSSAGTLADPYLRLMNSSGTQITANDDRSSSTLDARITYTATATGTFYVVASSLNDSGTGTYTVVVNQQSGTGSAAPLRVEGATGFDIDGAAASLHADRIVNTSATRPTGPLRLELWYLSAPYGRGGATGYKVVQASIGALSPGQVLTGVAQAGASLTTPPVGQYYPTLLLTEYDTACGANDGFCVAADVAFEILTKH